MANEITVNSNMTIRGTAANNNASLQHTTNPTQFRGNILGNNGPYPGSLLATPAGLDVSFAQAAAGSFPGYCRLQNLDPTNFVTYGIWNGADFYPLGELLPGESYVIRLSRQLGFDYAAGTGTSPAGSGFTLRLRADTANCRCLVEAFDA